MIKMYVTNGCLGCRQAKKFFEQNNLEYIEKDVTKEKLTRQELVDILSLTENGFADILSIRSKVYQQIKDEVDELKTNDAIEKIIENPEILSRPIIIQYINNFPLRLLIGYNASDIEIFLRRDDTPVSKKLMACPFVEECHDFCDKNIESKLSE